MDPEPSRIFYSSALLRQRNLATMKTFVANTLKKGTNAQMEMNKFYCCKGSATYVIGASFSKPYTSVTALRKCVCKLACLLACGHIP